MNGFHATDKTRRHELTATVCLLCGLGMLLAVLLANPEENVRGEITPGEIAKAQPDPAASNRDGAILASCMNGQHISVGEGYVLTCRVRPVKM